MEQKSTAYVTKTQHFQLYLHNVCNRYPLHMHSFSRNPIKRCNRYGPNIERISNKIHCICNKNATFLHSTSIQVCNRYALNILYALYKRCYIYDPNIEQKSNKNALYM